MKTQSQPAASLEEIWKNPFEKHLKVFSINKTALGFYWYQYVLILLTFI